MAMKWHRNNRNLMVGQGLLAGFVPVSSAYTGAISIYSGVQPTAADLKANWINFKTSVGSLLAHYPSAVFTQPNYGILLQLAPVPASVLALNTGDGTWCILWDKSTTQLLMDGDVLPSNKFILGPVSNDTGPGVIRFADTSFTTGVSKVIFDGSIDVTAI